MHRLRVLLIAVSILAVIAGLRCGSDDGGGPVESDLTITPDSAVVELSASQSFEASKNQGAADVKWFVDDERGGNAVSGMISASGLYVGPSTVPVDSVVTVKAVDASDPAEVATAHVLIRGGQGVQWIAVTPSDTTLSPGESIVFGEEAGGTGRLADEIVWSVESLWGGAGDVGSIGEDGSYTVPTTLTESVPLMIKATDQSSGRIGIARVMVAVPVEFAVEMEDYTDWHDDERGDYYLRSLYCSQASGNYMVKYMDYPGEWIEVPFSVPAMGTYELTLRYAASAGDTLRATASFEGCGAPMAGPEVDFVLDKGAGLG